MAAVHRLLETSQHHDWTLLRMVGRGVQREEGSMVQKGLGMS